MQPIWAVRNTDVHTYMDNGPIPQASLMFLDAGMVAHTYLDAHAAEELVISRGLNALGVDHW